MVLLPKCLVFLVFLVTCNGQMLKLTEEQNEKRLKICGRSEKSAYYYDLDGGYRTFMVSPYHFITDLSIIGSKYSMKSCKAENKDISSVINIDKFPARLIGQCKAKPIGAVIGAFSMPRNDYLCIQGKQLVAGDAVRILVKNLYRTGYVVECKIPKSEVFCAEFSHGVSGNVFFAANGDWTFVGYTNRVLNSDKAYDILEIVYINSFRDEICKTTGICDEPMKPTPTVHRPLKKLNAKENTEILKSCGKHGSLTGVWVDRRDQFAIHYISPYHSITDIDLIDESKYTVDKCNKNLLSNMLHTNRPFPAVLLGKCSNPKPGLILGDHHISHTINQHHLCIQKKRLKAGTTVLFKKDIYTSTTEYYNGKIVDCDLPKTSLFCVETDPDAHGIIFLNTKGVADSIVGFLTKVVKMEKGVATHEGVYLQSYAKEICTASGICDLDMKGLAPVPKPVVVPRLTTLPTPAVITTEAKIFTTEAIATTPRAIPPAVVTTEATQPEVATTLPEPSTTSEPLTSAPRMVATTDAPKSTAPATDPPRTTIPPAIVTTEAIPPEVTTTTSESSTAPVPPEPLTSAPSMVATTDPPEATAPATDPPTTMIPPAVVTTEANIITTEATAIIPKTVPPAVITTETTPAEVVTELLETTTAPAPAEALTAAPAPVKEPATPEPTKTQAPVPSEPEVPQAFTQGIDCEKTHLCFDDDIFGSASQFNIILIFIPTVFYLILLFEF